MKKPLITTTIAAASDALDAAAKLPELMSAAQVAEYLGVSTPTVYRWEEQGWLPPAATLGPNAVRWRRSEIDVVIAARQKSRAAGERAQGYRPNPATRRNRVIEAA